MGGVVSGPAPKKPEDRARRNKPPTADLVLPAEGYQGPTPEWPMPGRNYAADRELWATLWHTPQAAAWIRLGPGAVRVVARYVQLCRQAGTDWHLNAEVRQLEDRLGLNPLAMRRLGWDIVQPDIEGAAVPRESGRKSRWSGLAVAE
jgi:hypothetical protein